MVGTGWVALGQWTGRRSLFGTLRLAFLLGLGLFWLAPAVAEAQQDDPRIAIIDMQRVLREAVAVQELQARVDEDRRAYQESLREREQALRAADRDLNEERGDLSQEEYRIRLRELELEAAAVQRDIQERRGAIDRVFSQGIGQVQEMIVRLVAELAEKDGIDLVLTKSSVVLVAPGLEITDATIAELNERLPEVEPPVLEEEPSE